MKLIQGVKVLHQRYIVVIIAYSLILLESISAFWIIWSRFLRERVVRDIPDPFLTEYRFWILLYICFIYCYAIKTLLFERKPNPFFNTFIEYFYIPLYRFDMFMKHRVLGKKNYMVISHFIVDFFFKRDTKFQYYILISFQIIPRTILVIFLVSDTFYFNKLALFYKIIFLGLLPFIFRYFKYSLKDLFDYWIKELDTLYCSVLLFKEGHEYQKNDEVHEDDLEYGDDIINYDLENMKVSDAPYHYKEVVVHDYIEIKFQNEVSYLNGDVDYKYIGKPRSKILMKEDYYAMGNIRLLQIGDDHDIHRLFHELAPKILCLKWFLSRYILLEKRNFIRFSKILIFSFYLVCWSFILIVSYWCYPVEFHMFKYFFNNLKEYLILMAEPFASLEQCSFNENLLTIENIKLLLKTIWNDISSRWKK